MPDATPAHTNAASKEGTDPPHQSPRQQGLSRRRVLGGLAGLTAGALTLGACTGDEEGATEDVAAPTGAQAAGEGSAAQSSGGSLLDQIASEGRVRLAVDLGFAPLQFRDPETDEPTGFSIEVMKLLMAELEAEIEWVEIPFAQLVPAVETGRADMSGIAATHLPSRARSVAFSRWPTFIESNMIVVSSDARGRISALEDLNNPDVRIAVQVGSSQADQVPRLVPDATYVELEQAQAQQEVSSGRADALISSEFALLSGSGDLDLENVEVLDVPPLFSDINTFFMPLEDYKLHAFVDNFLMFITQRGTLAELWAEWIADDTQRELGVDSISIKSPWVAASQVL